MRLERGSDVMRRGVNSVSRKQPVRKELEREPADEISALDSISQSEFNRP